MNNVISLLEYKSRLRPSYAELSKIELLQLMVEYQGQRRTKRASSELDLIRGIELYFSVRLSAETPELKNIATASLATLRKELRNLRRRKSG